ncbi:MAG TPA: hypothetical protein VEC37_09575, partial [Bacillota bacterium]|nr:hypothetical protein [Bacillota bacterium]
MSHPVTLVFHHAPENVVSNYLQTMGVTIDWDGVLVSNSTKIAIIFFSGLFFLVLSTLVMRQRKMIRI